MKYSEIKYISNLLEIEALNKEKEWKDCVDEIEKLRKSLSKIVRGINPDVLGPHTQEEYKAKMEELHQKKLHAEYDWKRACNVANAFNAIDWKG